MSTAQKSPLALPEILTSILLHLDITTLLLSQRVSKCWNELITTSPTLQQALFFTSSDTSSPPILNPLLVAKFPAWFTTNQEVSRWDLQGYEDFQNLGRARQIEDAVIKGSQFEYRRIGKADMVKVGRRENAWNYKKASWRNMLVVQPAAREILIHAETSSMGGRSEGEAHIKVEEGVRMGMCYDYVWNRVRTPFSSFGFDWRGVEGALGDAGRVYSQDVEWLDDEEAEVYEGGIGRPKYEGTRKWSERGKWKGRVKLKTSYTHQCSGGGGGNMMWRLRSDAYRDWTVDWERKNPKENSGNRERERRGGLEVVGTGDWKAEWEGK